MLVGCGPDDDALPAETAGPGDLDHVTGANLAMGLGGLPVDVGVSELQVRDEDLREELVQLELDELLTRDGIVADSSDPAPRH